MIFDILTLFPEMFASILEASILGKAIERSKITVNCHNIRDFAFDKHRMTDDTPFGGGSGMVMKPEPLIRGIEAVRQNQADARVILLSPQGRQFNQDVAWELTRWPRLILVCGRYEGVDERVRQVAVDEELSIGNYILTGGELAAMVIVDAVARLIPGVLGDESANLEESFSKGLLEYPQYTRPRDFRGHQVPNILLSGDHSKIADWRQKKAIEQTLKKRPELLEDAPLAPEDREHLDQLRRDLKK